MSRNADEVRRQSPTPSTGAEGSDLRSVANQIEGLLDDDGQFNPTGKMSRGHPDYDESKDPRARQDRDDRGRFKAAAADEEADDTGDEDETLDIPAEAAEEGDTPDEDTGDGDTDEELAASADEEAQTDEQETAIESLAQFADALEIPLEDLKAQIKHTFNAAGEEITVTLAELEKGYQKDADYRRSTAKLAEERKAAEQEFVSRVQQFEQANHLVAAQMNAVEQMLTAEMNDPRLAELRQRDPGEWTARREEIGQKISYLRNARQQAAQQFQQVMAQNLQQQRDRGLQELHSAIPDFGETHRAQAKEALSSLGLTKDEVGNVLDHRIILGALELASLRKEVEELRQLKTAAQDTVKRVKKEIPKLQKPGKRRENLRPVKRSNLSKLRDRARKSGNVKDAAKVIEQLI